MNFCARQGCMEHATLRPVLTAYTRKDRKMVRLELNMGVCKAHASKDPDEFLDDDAWQKLVNNLARQHMTRPKRSTARVHYEEMAEC